MSTALNLELMRFRALLLRYTDKVNEEGCRTAAAKTIEMPVDTPQGRYVTMLALGYYCRHKHWPIDLSALGPSCNTKGCVIHVDIQDDDALNMQLVAQVKPTRSLAQIFREGKKRGWFRGGGGYA